MNDIGRNGYLTLRERLHALHRVWRYRLRTERNEIRFMLSRKLSGTTLVDVGAHRGAYTYWMSRMAGPSGHVVAFEPQPELQSYLRGMAHAFNWQNVEISSAALSNETGRGKLFRPDHWGGASLIHRDGAEIEIDVDTLDRYFAGRPDLRPVSFIKCDVEGHEMSVFEGGANLIRSDQPIIIFEWHDRIIDIQNIKKFARSMNLEIFFFIKSSICPIYRINDYRNLIKSPYLNLIMMKSSIN